MSTTLVERASSFLESHLSRRSFINRSAMAASAVAVGSGVDLLLKPGTAYGAICTCGSSACGCGSTCCAGFSEFCCSINGGYNYCPTDTMMGGWWRADNSSFCGGPRYYMDCHALCGCSNGCGGGWGFCDTSCDGVNCGCGPGGCNSWVTGLLPVPLWAVQPTDRLHRPDRLPGGGLCPAVDRRPHVHDHPGRRQLDRRDDGGLLDIRPAVATPAPASSVLLTPDQCMATGLAASADAGGYAMVTSFGKVLPFGDFPSLGDVSNAFLAAPVVGMAATPTGHGYWLAAADGGIFAFGDAGFYGSMGGRPLAAPIVGMAATPTGHGYWLAASDGGIFAFGDAGFYGSMGAPALNRPIVGMARIADGPRVLAGGVRRRHLRLRRRRLLRLDGRAAPQRRPSWAWGPPPPVTGTGWWPPTAASSPSATPPSTAPWVASSCSARWWAWRRPAAGYWMVAADGGIFSFDVAFYGSPA